VVDDPVWLLLEGGAAGVDVHGLLLHHRLVALLRVLARGVEEEARCNRLQEGRRRAVGSKSTGGGE
jgi:hypothetical protein